MNVPIFRINEDAPSSSINDVILRDADVTIKAYDQSWTLSDFRSVWFRKGNFSPLYPAEPKQSRELLLKKSFPHQIALADALAKKCAAEGRVAREYFHHAVMNSGIRVLGNPFLGDPNKLIVSHEARRVGLRTPEFEVSQSLSDDHTADPERYVTKSLANGLYLWDFDGAGKAYFSYTEKLSDVASGTTLPRSFPSSLVQRKIEKQYEIRSFFLESKFYSFAIISQNDEQTAIDFRKYNYDSPNRNVPVDLPRDVEQKLDNLMKELKINTGSIDLIVDENGEYIFLEVNPGGQYGPLDEICNMAIDRLIAEWLRKGETDGRP